MKKIAMVIFCFLSINLLNAQENTALNINFGVPITYFNFRNIYIESNFSKPVFQNLFLGLGINYSRIDLKPSDNLFTYDRNTFQTYCFLGYSFFTKNEIIKFSPQVKIGYAFYIYSLNEFATKEQSDNGFFLAPGLAVNFKISDKWLVNAHLFYNIIFNSYKNNVDFAYPLSYIPIQDDHISNLNLGIGVSYKI